MKRILFLTGLICLLCLVSCKDEILLTELQQVTVQSTSSKDLSLKAQESVLINNELQITFAGIKADSRCPIDVVCVWAGDAEAVLNLKKGNLEKSIVLHSFLLPKEISFDGYDISLTNVLPRPLSTKKIEPAEYSVDIKITYNSSSTKQVIIIDNENDWVIKKNSLTVNSLSIDKDILAVNVSYSGGCKDHFVDLYAYKGIAKSIPPQISLVLSHNSNEDMCEAYITRTINFDLRRIKDYLGAQGTTGSVILNISGVDGKPLKQSPVSYKF